MFRIELFVEDKHLAKALIGVQGVALQQPTVQPVANAKVGKNGVQAITDGSICEMFRQHLIDNKLTSITPSEIKVWLASVGRQPSSFQYAVNCGVKAGWLKRRGKGNKVFYVRAKVKGVR